MKIGTFSKGAFAGGVGAFVVMGATAALAGTGIGGVFNLGQTNTVNGTSALTGSEAGAGLHVTNTSTATGATALSLTSATGKPPLTVSNKAVVPLLDSSYVGGYKANGLNRVGMSSSERLFGIDSTETDGQVTITAPTKGFVKVEATFVAEDAFSSSLCGRCLVEARLHDVSANTDSPVTIATGGAGSTPTYVPVSLQWVFAAAAGARTYSLTTAQSDTGGPFSIDNSIVTAQFTPFGSTGSPSTLAGTVASSPHPTPSAGLPVIRGAEAGK
jgi:hypothetical protein